MGIRIIRKGKSYRRWWYGEYREGGKLCRIKLGVKVSGRPPESFSCKDVGDSAFEVSKAKAQSAFDDFMESRQQKGNAEGLLENLIKSKTGEKVSYVRMDELAELWNGLARTRELAERRKRDNACVINRFAKSCGREYLYQVSAADVIAYFNEIRKTLAWSSVKSHMSILSGAFNRFLPNGCANPFKKVIKRDTSEEAGTIHRIPLTNVQIEKVRKLARQDEMLYNIFVCGLSTGARLKDICFMKKSSIDLKDGFVTFVAAKTRTRCDLPLFGEFRTLCESIINSSDPDEPLLFPDAARMYEHNYSGLIMRGKLLFAHALFDDAEKEDDNATLIVDGAPLPPKSHDEILALIDEQHYSASKTQRMKDVYERYVTHNQSYREIMEATGIGKGCICEYMSELEKLSGDKLIRFEKGKSKTRSILARTRIKRKSTNRAVSAYGWSCLRPTFCVLAIESGVESKQIMLAVGHKQFSTTLTYYNNPTREHQKQMWLKKAAGTPMGSNGEDIIESVLANLSSNDLVKLMQKIQSLLPIDNKGVISTTTET